MIVVINQAESKLNYKLTGYHDQNNNIILVENTPHVDASDMKTYKYFQFTLLDSRLVESISFELNPHHGDADLFISRDFQFPHKENYGRKSQRTGSLVDVVAFVKDENDATTLAGVYYIGVYAYTYTTYSITPFVHRSGDFSV